MDGGDRGAGGLAVQDDAVVSGGHGDSAEVAVLEEQLPAAKTGPRTLPLRVQDALADAGPAAGLRTQETEPW